MKLSTEIKNEEAVAEVFSRTPKKTVGDHRPRNSNLKYLSLNKNMTKYKIKIFFSF